MLVVLGVTTTVLAHRRDGSPAVTASSSAPGTHPQQLLADVPDGRGPTRSVTWASEDETIGAWLVLDWGRPTTVDSIRLFAADDVGRAPRSLLLGFDDGSSLLVTPDGDGDADVTFSERRTSTMRITVAEAAPGTESVALAALSVDDSGDAEPSTPADAGPARVDASSGADTGALQDGDAGTGTAGAEWVAAAADPAPWVRVSWPAPVEVSSVQVLGPSTRRAGGNDATSAALRGVLRFDDGSEVVVSGIATGQAQPSTIAFAPRRTSSVRLELTAATGTPGATALREFHAYGPDTTPPRWPAADPTYSARPPVAGCAAGGVNPAGATFPSRGELTLLCPTVGSIVSGTATVVVGTAAGVAVEAWAPVVDDGSPTPVARRVAMGTAGTDGRAVLTWDTREMPGGPVTVQVRRSDDDAEPLPVQLLVRGGNETSSPGFAAPGKTLQFEDDFNEPLSISATGAGAVYAAGKPTSGGVESFGDAAFADPALGAGTVATVDGYLRLRARPTGALTAAAAFGQDYLSGMLSSARPGGSGFAAQYGYFEARMTGAPGSGTWPAFWTLNTQSATRDDADSGEADVVELYGHNPLGSCHRVHHHNGPEDDGAPDDQRNCKADNGFSDWSVTWHTYGMQVEPGGATFFIDGVRVVTEPGLGRSDEPFFFMLDLALGSGYPVDLSATGGTSDLYVDWVRAYT